MDQKVLVLKIIAFELGTTNCENPRQDNCHWQSMCYETTLRLKISLSEIFSKSGSQIVMEKYDESALMQISQAFGRFNILIVKGVSETVFFKEWSNQVFNSL